MSVHVHYCRYRVEGWFLPRMVDRRGEGRVGGGVLAHRLNIVQRVRHVGVRVPLVLVPALLRLAHRLASQPEYRQAGKHGRSQQ